MKWKVNKRSADVRLTPNYGGQPSPGGNKYDFGHAALAGVPAVAPASAGRRKNEVEGKQEVRRRSTDAELWRTAFARWEQIRFRPCSLSWRASRSSGVSRAKEE